MLYKQRFRFNFEVEKREMGSGGRRRETKRRGKQAGWSEMRNSLSCRFVVSQEHFRRLHCELLFCGYAKLMASLGILGPFHPHCCLHEQPQIAAAFTHLNLSGKVPTGHGGLFQSALNILLFYLARWAQTGVQGFFEKAASGWEVERAALRDLARRLEINLGDTVFK